MISQNIKTRCQLGVSVENDAQHGQQELKLTGGNHVAAAAFSSDANITELDGCEEDEKGQLWRGALHPCLSLNAVLCNALALRGALYALHVLINLAWLRYQ
ncbi:hypothetical protein T07_6232 [Trichinella nelsoni]|uniref:Uncharacterized protein n=1 Tax=Trichinella nelsoni TaxID=6336 RepID=A0A0V0RY40_9BILA|nr:hypothetical protein T07_6232 [Trichinella nelsoni]